VNITPDPEEIVQAEEPYDPSRPINVSVCGPTQVRELPAAGYPGYKTESVTSAVGVRLLSLEPRRKYATILPIGGDIWISSSQAGAQAGPGGAMRLPASVAHRIGHIHELWACADSAPVSVSIETVNWSE
jgi:hypothetical protein